SATASPDHKAAFGQSPERLADSHPGAIELARQFVFRRQLVAGRPDSGDDFLPQGIVYLSIARCYGRIGTHIQAGGAQVGRVFISLAMSRTYLASTRSRSRCRPPSTSVWPCAMTRRMDERLPAKIQVSRR